MDTVLLVDDEEGIRLLFRRWLERAGYAVLDAADADAAVRLLKSHPIAVAVCDIRMPGKDGETLAIELSQQFPSVSIVFVTANLTLSARVSQLPQVCGHMTKPVTRQALLEHLSTAMRWRRARGTAREPTD